MHTAGVDHIPTLLRLLIEGRYVFRPILKVAVHHDNVLALGIAQARRDGIVFSEVAAQIKTNDTLIYSTDLTYGFPHIVRRTVIDEYNFITVRQRLQDGMQPFQQFRQHRLPAILWDDYRYIFLILFHLHLKLLISRTTVSASS